MLEEQYLVLLQMAADRRAHPQGRDSAMAIAMLAEPERVLSLAELASHQQKPAA